MNRYSRQVDCKAESIFGEATEMPTELKSEISDTLDFLRDRARYYQQSYREEIA